MKRQPEMSLVSGRKAVEIPIQNLELAAATVDQQNQLPELSRLDDAC